MQKNYAKFLTLLALGAGCNTARAQTDFRPGYVVRAAGDTVRGEVDYRDARTSAKQCRFRPSVGAPAITFQPAELRGYGLPGERKLYRVLAPATGAPASFLEVLVDGSARLYSLRDEDRADHYYVATETFPLTELMHRKVIEGQASVVHEQNTYRATLAQALPGCPVAQAQLPTLRYTAAELARVIAAYNNCQASPADAAAIAASGTPRGPHPRLGIVLGAERVAMHVEYPDPSGFSSQQNKLEFSPKVVPIAGLALHVPLPAFSRNLSLGAALLYESLHFDQQFDDKTAGGTNRFTFDMGYLRLPLMLRYTFPKGRVQPFVEAGPTLAYAVQLRNSVTKTDYLGRTRAPEGFFQDNFRHLQEGLSGGLGAQFSFLQGRPATILVRYEADTGWASGQGINTWSSHIYGLFAVDLFK